MDAHRRANVTLDASLVEAWWHCERRAWLQVHAPAEAGVPDGLTRYLAEQRADLRALVRRTFVRGAPGAGDRVRNTGEGTLQGDSLVFDATFEAPLSTLVPSGTGGLDGRVRGAVDLLQRSGDGWDLTALAAGTRVRDHHVRRLALASLVADSRQIHTRRAWVLHVDRRGRPSDPSSLLEAVEVTDRCFEQRSRLPRRVAAVTASLATALEPDTAVGSHCHRPRRCPFVEHCWAPLGDRSTYHVWRLRTTTRLAWRSAGWLTIDRVPEGGPGLTDDERQGFEDARDGRVRIERDALRTALAQLSFPIAYLDMEFATAAVPLIDAASPFEPFPFQFSVHLERQDGSVEHVGDLRYDLTEDPRPPLAEALARALDQASSIVVYDAASERRLLDALQRAAPEVAPRLEGASQRLWDLLATVQRTVRHPGFAARWDLKQVATTLAPRSFENVRVPDGLTAQAQWRKLLRRHDTAAEDALRRYCDGDSWAMLEIVRVLRHWVRHGGPPMS